MKIIKMNAAIGIAITLSAAMSLSLPVKAQGGLGGANIEMCQSGAINCGYPASHKANTSEKQKKKEYKPNVETSQLESVKLKRRAIKVSNIQN